MFPTVEEFRGYVEHGNITSAEISKIQQMQYNFANYSPEDQSQIQSIIEDVIQIANEPAREELRVLSSTIDEHNNLVRTNSDRQPVRNEVTLEGGRNISSWTPEAVSKNNDSVPLHTETPLFGSSLERIDVSQEAAWILAQTIPDIEKPITHEALETWQEGHHIDNDGIIGKETYGEMYALKLETEIKREFSRSSHISEGTQEKVKDLLEYANKSGSNIQILVSMVGSRLTQIKTNIGDGFDEKYGEFDELISGTRTAIKEDPEIGASADQGLNRENSSGGSFGGDLVQVFEGNMEIGELLERNKGTAIFAGIAAFIFFGNKIPGFDKVPGMGSWIGRIAWLIGGAALGGGDLIEYGIGKVGEGISSGNNYVRSPEARETFNSATTAISGFFTETIPDIFGEGSEEIMTGVTNFISNFESQNENRKNSNEFIDNIVEKGSIITSDRLFLNASRESIQRAYETGDLSGIMSQEGMEKLRELNMSVEDIKNYLGLYVLTRFNDTHNNFSDTFIPSSLLDSGRELVLDITGTFIENPRLNTVISSEIAILRNVGTDAQKHTATQLAIAIQSGNLSGFKIDDYPSLDSEEKSKFENLISKLEIIFKTEKYIQDQTDLITAITIVGGATPDTADTLKQKIQNLEDLKANFGFDDSTFEHIGLTHELFSVSEYDAVYTEKKDELLRAAAGKGVTEIILTGGVTINIESYILEAEVIEVRETENTGLNEIIESIGEVPESDATILVMRRFYEDNSSGFDSLKQVVQEHIDAEEGSHEFVLKTRAQEALEKLNTLKTNYIEAREGIVVKMSELNARLDGISTDDIDSETYQASVVELHSISGEFEQISVNIMDGYTAKDATEAFTAYFTGTPIFPDEKNSVSFLDDLLLGDTSTNEDLGDIALSSLPGKVKAKVIELEGAYDTDVSRIADIISTSSELEAYVNELNRRKEIVDTFKHDATQEIKHRAIAEQFLALQGLYLHAINAENDPIEAAKILSSYQDFVSPSITSGFWQDSWDSIKNIFTERDPVEIAYATKSNEFETFNILDVTAGSARGQEILTQIGYFEFDEDTELSEPTRTTLHALSGDTNLNELKSALEVIVSDPNTFSTSDVDKTNTVLGKLNDVINNQNNN